MQILVKQGEKFSKILFYFSFYPEPQMKMNSPVPADGHILFLLWFVLKFKA